MLDLESASVVGKGLHRVCYAHPQDERLCVKVLLQLQSKTPLIEAEREAKYYRFLDKKNVPWTMLPKFHGEVLTSRGQGYIFDLIRDYDGEFQKHSSITWLLLSKQIIIMKAYRRLLIS